MKAGAYPVVAQVLAGTLAVVFPRGAYDANTAGWRLLRFLQDIAPRELSVGACAAELRALGLEA